MMNERHRDFELLQRFTRFGEQAAFEDLVRRHLDLVFGTALRKVEDSGAAQEVVQNVFTVLARTAIAESASISKRLKCRPADEA